jgi:hypothetical protein
MDRLRDEGEQWPTVADAANAVRDLALRRSR